MILAISAKYCTLSAYFFLEKTTMRMEHQYFFFSFPKDAYFSAKMAELFKKIEQFQEQGWKLITLQREAPAEHNCFVETAFVVVEREKKE